MKMPLNDLERSILRAIQGGLPGCRSPFRELAQTLGITVEQLLTILKQWKAAGKIRRSGAIVNHFRMGQGAGAMVVWQVPDNRVDAIGKLFGSLDHVSHAYLRPEGKQWPYNIYTMVHASDDDALETIIRNMSAQSGIAEHRILRTVRELKKSPPQYITDQ
jgi:DNA-binding Lrp family transcriptional regulator